MKAEFCPVELTRSLALLTKGMRGKRARQKARALLRFDEDSVHVEFNEVAAGCAARVSKGGEYALNPFLLKDFLKTFRETEITMEISRNIVRIGRTRTTHSQLDGSFEEPQEALQSWADDRTRRLKKRVERIARDAEREALYEERQADLLSDARYVAYRRTDGGIEYGAAVLKYERGEVGHRKVLVKTKDFLEGWISELQIVSFGKDPQLDFEP